MHDIGKIRVPAEVLARPGAVTDAEMTLIREHSRVGFDILRSVGFPSPLCRMVLEHHERLDGSGYPAGLRADEIAMGAKIIAVADLLDAMTSNRPYRPALGISQAIEELRKGDGRLFDSDVVAACLRLNQVNRLLDAPQ